MSAYEKLKELKIELPKPTTPVAAFVMAVQTGNLVFVSGHIARKDGKPWVGQLGKDLTTEQGRAAAHGIAIDLLATLHGHLGDLDRGLGAARPVEVGDAGGEGGEAGAQRGDVEAHAPILCCRRSPLACGA